MGQRTAEAARTTSAKAPWYEATWSIESQCAYSRLKVVERHLVPQVGLICVLRALRSIEGASGKGDIIHVGL
jgi:hypothetical protein